MILRVFQPQWFSGNDNYCPLRKKLLICISAVRLLQQADMLCVETAAFQSYNHVQSTTTLVLPFLCSQRTTGVMLFQNLQCIFRFSPKVFQISTEKNFRCSRDEGLHMNCLVVWFRRSFAWRQEGHLEGPGARSFKKFAPKPSIRWEPRNTQHLGTNSARGFNPVFKGYIQTVLLFIEQ